MEPVTLPDSYVWRGVEVQLRMSDKSQTGYLCVAPTHGNEDGEMYQAKFKVKGEPGYRTFKHQPKPEMAAAQYAYYLDGHASPLKPKEFRAQRRNTEVRALPCPSLLHLSSHPRRHVLCRRCRRRRRPGRRGRRRRRRRPRRARRRARRRGR